MGQIVPISLAKGSNKGRHGLEGIASNVNAYQEQIGEGGKVAWAIYAINGLEDFATLTGGGATRAMLTVDDTVLIVSDRTLFSTNVGGSPVTTVGGIPSDGFVTMARNRQTPNPQVAIVCDGLWFIYQGGVLTQGTDPDLPPPIAVVEIDGYFVFLIADGRWFISAIDDDTIDGLDFTAASSSPDANVMAAVRGRELVIFGKQSMEFYIDNAANEDFPFSRVATAALGCFAAGSVQKVIAGAGQAVDTVVWASTDHKGSYNGIRILDGYSGRAISTNEVDTLVLAEPDPGNLRSMAWTEDGHVFYAISGTNFTKVFDMAYAGQPETGWHDRKSFGLNRWRAQCHAQIGQTHIFGDYAANKLYRSSPTVMTDAGEVILFQVTTPVVTMGPYRFLIHALYIDALTGVGVNSTVDADANPMLMLDYTKDGGASFSAQRLVPLGAEAQRYTRLKERSFGRFDKNGVSFRFGCSASVVKGLLGAHVDVEKIGA